MEGWIRIRGEGFFSFFFLILIYEIINRGSKNITNIVDLRSSLIQSLVILTDPYPCLLGIS